MGERDARGPLAQWLAKALYMDAPARADAGPPELIRQFDAAAVEGADESCRGGGEGHFDRRANKDVLRIATLNAKWLFDGGSQLAPWKDAAAAEEHAGRVAAAVAAVDADVVALAEVESCAMLQRLLERYNSKG